MVRLIYYNFETNKVTHALVYKKLLSVVVIESTAIVLLQANQFRHISKEKEATVADALDRINERSSRIIHIKGVPIPFESDPDSF